MSQVTRPVRLIVPVSLYRIGEQLHHVLRYYKDHPSEHVRAELRARAVALLARFLRNHSACIEEQARAEWDYITSVPSSSGRSGTHPLENAMGLVPTLRDEHQSVLRPGPASLDHNTAADDGYVVTRSVKNDSILLIDDTFTSGARAQSAASALQLAEAQVIAIVPIGRVVNPHYSEETKDYWRKARAIPFSFDNCCLDVPP